MAMLDVRQGRLTSTNNKGHKLTPKMLTFIDAYFGEAKFNGAEAIRLSSYSPGKDKDYAHKKAAALMAHPLIREEIARRQTTKAVAAEVKAEYLISKLMQIIEAEQTQNPQAALRAIELAGKSIALFKERQEISGPGGEAIKHEQQVKESVADFTNRIAAIAKRSGNAGQPESSGTSSIIEFPKRSGTG